MDNKLILTDLDDVALNWGKHFEEWYIKIAPQFQGKIPSKSLADAGIYNIEEWIGCDLATTRKLVDQFNQCKDHFPYLTPYADAEYYINRLHKEGYKFVAITACATDKWTYDARYENLNRYFPGVFDTIHLVGLSKPKTEILSRYKPTWWVDDKTRHAEDGGQLGHKAFCMSHKYNQNDVLKYSKRVKNWQEIYNCIVDENCYRLGWMA